MSSSLKPNHASVKAYYETLHEHGQLHFDHEGAVRRAFQDLLAKCGRRTKPQLTLITEYVIERARSSIRVDGALVDLYHLPHGYWEAKDEKDDLAREVQRKLEKAILTTTSSRSIINWAIFHYIYAVLHHPEYRQRLAEIHVTTNNNPNTRTPSEIKGGEKLDYRVTKMRLSNDKTTLTYNRFLTLSGISPETYEYRLGNRSALRMGDRPISGLN